MFIWIFLLFMLCIQAETTLISDGKTSIKIGVIVDLNSRTGKEQKTAMEIAVESFNNGGSSSAHKLSLNFVDYDSDGLLQAVFAARKLVEENQVQVLIIGLDDWQATTLIAQIGSQAQVPTFSLVASPLITPSLPYSLQFPFLVQMAHEGSQQMHHLVSIIHAYLWRRVTVVSEADPNNGDTGALSGLSEALQNVGSQIEHHLVLPPFACTTNPENAVQEAFSKFLNESSYSRVFVVLKVSPGYVSPLFKEAKGMGLMRNDSAWIITEAISNLLPCCLNASTMQNMEGALGLMTKFDNSTPSFEEFQARFWVEFFKDYPKETNYEPGFHALLAYDAISTITAAISHLTNKTSTQSHFLKAILQSNFAGLSGHISFNQENNTLRNDPDMNLVNIVGGNYQEILDFASDDIEDDNVAKRLAMEMITWPGNFTERVPKGWVMPTLEKRMRIGVPVEHNYKNFIDYRGPCKKNEVCESKNITRENEEYGGLCPELFREVLEILDYELPYQFIPYFGTYDDLVKEVYNKTFDAVVGDVTILANRTELVDFTLPFEESLLSLILPVNEPYDSEDPWIFLRPFTPAMWLVTSALMIYTMLAVWCLEKDKGDFKGSFWEQLSTALWFIFSSLFFAQKEKVSNNLARVVVVTWLFIVLILTSSYTANLTSMLTIARLNQTTIDTEMLQRTNARVGYDNSSFVNKFLEDLFQFNASNIVGIEGKFEEFHAQFKEGNIKAAFLEDLYAELFVSQYCNQYSITTPRYRYGGLAFVFPKGSPVAQDVSLAILKLIENEKVKDLEKKWLNINSDCYVSTDDFTTTNNGGNNGDQSSSLRLKSFWILFVFSGATSTLCFLAFLVSSWKKTTQLRVAPLPQ